MPAARERGIRPASALSTAVSAASALASTPAAYGGAMTNRLADTLSPYLRAHADNPVDWWPWSAEAFAEAGRREVPLMISIGYSTCHWCHVMARESFSDPATAAQINEGFVAVKIDREEHPEVDAAFMASASAFTQNLGWPLTVFLTPQGGTFYAGTYWPPQARGGTPAFRDVLTAVREAWTARRAEVLASADAVAEALRAAAHAPESALPDATALRAAAASIIEREDREFGGFGGAPKFPMATALRFLQHPLAGGSDAVDRALMAMSASELRDAVDGGFFRYATQRDWTVPHYERMLTDNAQLLEVALDAGRQDAVQGIVGFLLGVLRREGGGFGAAQDSESWIDGERSEGGYYRQDTAARSRLEPPAVDGKVLTGWNGLVIGALARAGAVLGEPAWVAAAASAGEHVLTVNRGTSGQLVRSSLDGAAADAVATSADVGLLADGLFALALATGDASWATRAQEVLAETPVPDPVLAGQGIPRGADDGDGDLPSGPAALASAHLTAWRLGAGEQHRARAEELVAGVAGRALQHPIAYGAILRVAAGLAQPPRQVVAVVASEDDELAHAARRTDAEVIAVVTPAQAKAFADAGFALFEGKEATEGVAYDCRDFVCRLPTSDPRALAVSVS
ncbi:thioredoxin domain-containing protein [Microbacterium suwonense]|uniref:thioredoxin domain-containing protein n=1 Tax=Microbacterium suwonense TaxID=683047 RepID=UPI003609087B